MMVALREGSFSYVSAYLVRRQYASCQIAFFSHGAPEHTEVCEIAQLLTRYRLRG